MARRRREDGGELRGEVKGGFPVRSLLTGGGAAPAAEASPGRLPAGGRLDLRRLGGQAPDRPAVAPAAHLGEARHVAERLGGPPAKAASAAMSSVFQNAQKSRLSAVAVWSWAVSRVWSPVSAMSADQRKPAAGLGVAGGSGGA
jgi:hypothetical protein